MKKIIAVLAIVLPLLYSCRTEMDSRIGSDGSVFYGRMEQTVSRTALSKNNVVWSEGDRIAVFANGSKNAFQLIEGAKTASGKFYGNIVEAMEYYAVYPYSESVHMSSSTIVAQIPQIQSYCQDGIGQGQNVTVAYTTGNTLNFKNVCALLKFEIASSNVGQITIRGNNGEDLAGEVEISFDKGLPVCTCTDGKKSVILKSEGKAFAPGCYYAAVLPNTFSKGITITLTPYVWTTDDVVMRCNLPAAEYVRTSSNKCVASRSSIVPLGCIDEDAVWTYPSVKINCLRDTGNQYGQYIDLNTGRTFFALGAYKYCEELDLAFMQWTGAGFCAFESAETKSIVNATNLGRYGQTVSDDDIVSNWENRNITNLCYLPSMTEEEYKALTAKKIAEIYNGCTPIVACYSNMDTKGINLNNARIQDGSQRYCVFKTGNPDEGVAVGVMKFTGVNGTTGAWEVDFDYKCAFLKGEPGFKPDPQPIQPVDDQILENPYGVCANPAAGDEKQYGQKEVDQIREMGAGWIREDFTWGWINSSKGGSWNFTFMDNNVQYAKAGRINILPIMCYDQSWATPLADHLDYWLEYVTKIVTRYKKNIRVWEVYNEPNHKNYWHSEAPNAERYTKVLKATYECIKNIDPDLSVLFGGLAGTAFDYTKQCFAAGAGDYCDAMNFHPYNITGKPEKLISDVSQMRKILSDYGCADKPLWITEIGWTSPVPLVANGVSEQTQAEYLPRTFLIAFAGGVGKTFWFQYRSPEKRESSDPDFYRDHYGIVHKDLTPKPAYYAYQTLTTMLPSGSTRPVLTNNGNIYLCHWKNPDGENVWAFWNSDSDTTASLSFTGTVKSACDLFGNDVSISAGSVSVKTGCTYVTGPESLTLN